MSADDTNHLPVLREPLSCANCGAAVAGPLCSGCGQRTDMHAHSLGHFLSEATEVLTHADARVWGTLRPLYRSMRAVYDQSRFLTSMKFVALACAYLVCGLFMLIATTFVSAMTL